MNLSSHGCSIHMLDLEVATNNRLPKRYTPTNWLHNQYAVELWLRHAIENHSWHERDPAKADVIFASANFSMWCVVGKSFSRRRLWDAAFHPKPLPLLASKPVFIARQYEGACGPAEMGKPIPSNVILLQEEVNGDGYGVMHKRLVSPFLVSKPPWLVGEGTPPPVPPWRKRKDIFFAGHVPKPYIRDTRYTIWRQLRNDPRATVISPTLYCTVGGFEACRRPEAFLARQNGSFFTQFCRFACASDMSLGGSSRRVQTFCLSTGRTNAAVVPLLHKELKKKCRLGYGGVDYGSELEDMRRDTRRLPHPEYLSQAMSHKFCLVAPGDFVSTHKVSEAMALGGAGGCIPVFVLPPAGNRSVSTDQTVDVLHYLPYTRWLDWCEVAYFVPERCPSVHAPYARLLHSLLATHASALTSSLLEPPCVGSYAREEMRTVLDLLNAAPEAELRAKRRRLKEVHQAFTFRAKSSPAAPSASDYIFAEACAASAAVRTQASRLAVAAQLGRRLASR